MKPDAHGETIFCQERAQLARGGNLANRSRFHSIIVHKLFAGGHGIPTVAAGIADKNHPESFPRGVTVLDFLNGDA